MFEKEQLEKQLLKQKIEQAKLEHLRVLTSFRPSRQLPISVTRDGGHWVCTFETDPDPLKCVTAYGDSPEQATRNFDQLWNGTGLSIEEESDEEEQF